MKDAIVLVVLVVAFATFVTTHVAIAVRLLLRREDRWRGAVAFPVLPLAPLWALRRGWKVATVFWIASVVLYAIALIIALR